MRVCGVIRFFVKPTADFPEYNKFPESIDTKPLFCYNFLNATVG